MKTFFLTSSLLLLASHLVGASPVANSNPPPAPVCGICNPLSGQNSCDPTTSCINTGKSFHCACRAGYKASKNNGNVTQQFRLQVPNYEFLVFTPENTVCDTLCDHPYDGTATLCSEVPIYTECEA